MKKRNSAGRLLAILLVALLVPAMAACSAKDGDQMTEQTEKTEQSETGSVTSDEPQNEEEALALYKELMEQENKILSENTDLWELTREWQCLRMEKTTVNFCLRPLKR